MPALYWPAMVEFVQSILDQTLSERLGRKKVSNTGTYLTPIVVFTELALSAILIRPQLLIKIHDLLILTGG